MKHPKDIEIAAELTRSQLALAELCDDTGAEIAAELVVLLLKPPTPAKIEAGGATVHSLAEARRKKGASR